MKPLGINAFGSSDPYIGNVGLLLHGEGINGGKNNTYLDSSPTAAVLTVSGTVPQGAKSPFGSGGGSAYINGQVANSVYAPANAAYSIPSGVDFTLECWFCIADNALPDGSGTRGGTLFSCFGQVNRGWQVCVKGDATTTGTGILFETTFGNIDATVPISQGVWHHVAVVRAAATGGYMRAYLDGVYIGLSGVTQTIPSTLDPLRIGRMEYPSYDRSFNGYVSNVRFVKGTAVYTADFTPPSLPLTAIPGTVFLFLGDNAALVDSSYKANISTLTGGIISTSQFKFGTSSIKFNGGTGEQITYPNIAGAQAFGTGDFTVEFWVYFNDVSGGYCLYDTRQPAEGPYPAIVYWAAAGGWLYWTNSAQPIQPNVTAVVNTWYHVALSRVASNTRLFINGVQVGPTYADTTNYGCGANVVLGNRAQSGGTWGLNGYLDEFRVTKGVGRYAANFTPPTAPFPNP